MAKVTKDLTALDRAAAILLVERLQAAELTRRDIREKTGMSLSRLHSVFTLSTPPLTVGELHILAELVGSSAWEIMEEVSQGDYILAASDADYDDEAEAGQALP